MAKATKAKGSTGFAGMDPEQANAIRKKGVAARKRNNEIRNQRIAEADKLRDEAQRLQEEAERLRQEADDIDGEYTADRSKKKKEAALVAEIDERFRDSVSAQYLKMIKQHAILRGLTADEIVTPSMLAMDILADPNTSLKEKQDARKELMQFENSKPIAKMDESTDVVGSAEEEFAKLMAKAEESSPKR